MSLEEIRRGTQRCLGPVLQLAAHLGAGDGSSKSLQGPARVRADLEAVPPDVREHRHRDRQRARGALGALGALARARRPGKLFLASPMPDLQMPEPRPSQRPNAAQVGVAVDAGS